MIVVTGTAVPRVFMSTLLRTVSATAAIAAACLSVAPARAGEPTTPTASDPNRFAVTGGDVARRLFHLADTRRIDLAIIGDSNVRIGGVTGHEAGMGRAFAARFGCYATRVDPFMSVGGWGSTIAGVASFQFSPFSTSAAPREATDTYFPTTWFPFGYGYLAPDQPLRTDYNSGLFVGSDCPIGIERALRYHLTHYRFRTPTTGRLSISIRSGLNANFASGTAPTAAATPGLSDFQLDVPAGDRPGGGLMCVPSNYVGAQPTRGPFLGLWQRMEAPGQLTGISYSPLLYQGGKSARAACASLSELGPAAPALHEWLRQVTRLQGAAPVLAVQILHTGNDFNDHQPSCGPVGNLDSSTHAGHADNLRGIMNTLRSAWAGMGFDPSNLYFVIGPYHPRGYPIDLQQSYEAEWIELASTNPNTIAIRGTLLSTFEEFQTSGWFASGGVDISHLSAAGFEAWGTATVEALQRAACPADLNHDRACSVEDIFVYLGGYFTGAAAADYNGDGATTLDDLFAFLGAWFQGC